MHAVKVILSILEWSMCQMQLSPSARHFKGSPNRGAFTQAYHITSKKKKSGHFSTAAKNPSVHSLMEAARDAVTLHLVTKNAANEASFTSLGFGGEAVVTFKELANVLPLFVRRLFPEGDLHTTTVDDHWREREKKGV